MNADLTWCMYVITNYCEQAPLLIFFASFQLTHSTVFYS